MHSFDTLNFGAFWQEKQEREGKQNWEKTSSWNSNSSKYVSAPPTWK